MAAARDDQVAETEPSDTRSRILRTSLELFSTRGYQRTSLRQIAEQLGITKAAVLYHFPAKDSIMAALVRPLLEDLESVVDHAATIPTDNARWTLLEGMLDAYMKHRPALLMMRRDLSILVYHARDYERFLNVAIRGHRVITGADASVVDRVLASQAIAMLGDPVILFPEVPEEDLRPMILKGVRQLLGGGTSGNGAADRGAYDDGAYEDGAYDDGASAGRPRARVAKSSGGVARRTGRPSVLDDERLATAQRLYATGTYSVSRLAAELGVSRATLYRHLDRGDAPNPA